jgi:hypothetical protein
MAILLSIPVRPICLVRTVGEKKRQGKSGSLRGSDGKVFQELVELVYDRRKELTDRSFWWLGGLIPVPAATCDATANLLPDLRTCTMRRVNHLE